MALFPITIKSPTLLIGGTPPVSEAVPTIVSIKNRWDGTWIVNDDIIPERLLWATGNSQFGQATFLYRYGKQISRTIAPADWMRWFIKAEGPGFSWVGQINAQPVALLGGNQGVPSGAMKIIADSMESIFYHGFVTDSVVADYDAPPQENGLPQFRTAQQGLTFNFNGAPNQASETFPNTKRYFAKESKSKSWSTRDIVYYALQQWIPLNQSGTQAGVTVTMNLADAARLPGWDAPVVDTHGYRPIEIINRVVSRRRLLMWWLELDETFPSNPQMKFRTATYSSSDVVDGDGNQIPGNDQQYILNVDDDASAEVVVEEDGNSFADQVVVQGAKRRSCFSVEFRETRSVRHQGIPYWTQKLEEEYEDGGFRNQNYPPPEKRGERRAYHAQFRSGPRFRDVFARFGLDPKIPIPPGDPDQYRATPFVARLVPTLPFLEGRDYTGNHIKEGRQLFDTRGRESEIPMIVFLRIDSPKFGDLPVWVDAAKMSQTDDVPAKKVADKYKFSCSVKVVENDISFRLEVKGGEEHQHVLSSGFVPAQIDPHGVFQGRAEDKNRGNIDWRDMVATVAMEDDRYCQGVYPNTTSGQLPFRRLLIDAGENYRQDWVAPYTAVDTRNATGELLISTGGFFRDDTAKLESIARRAYEYYGTIRGILRMKLTYRNLGGNTPFQRGAFITAVNNGTLFFRNVNSPVTQVLLEFPVAESDVPITTIGVPQLSITTSFGELDSAFFMGNYA